MSYDLKGLQYTFDSKSHSYALGNGSNILKNAVVGSISPDLVIPKFINNYPVTKILSNALYGQILSSITLPDSLIEI